LAPDSSVADTISDVGLRAPAYAAPLTSVINAVRGGARRSLWDDDRPIREELFSVERLEEHARSLAAAQAVTVRPLPGRDLARRLADNEKLLVGAYRDIAEAIDAGAAITPAAEWLIDNFHVVEEQIRQVRSDLPAGYYRVLPKLAGGPFAGLPRVFGLSWAFVAHTDSHFDPETLRRFVRAYQQVQPLDIGELWAVAITLRVILLENLRRIAQRVVASRAGRKEADALADRLLGARGLAPEPPQVALAAYSQLERSDAFFVQLVQRLRDQDPSVGPALSWIEERLASRGASPDVVVRVEHQRQVAASITVRNIITSMRLISDVDWSELVERISLVDDLFLAASRFGEMDFPTRNLYRAAIEELARGSGLGEIDVGRTALAAASQGEPDAEGAGDQRFAEPGYYLIGAGRGQFEKAIGFRAPARAWAGRAYRALGIGGYVGAGALLAAAILAVPLWLAARAGLGTPWLWLLGVLGIAPAVDLSVAFVNHVVTRGVRATLLPALELKGALPASMRTLVVTPTLLTSKGAIDEQVERLEIHYLSSPEGELYFALLTDWTDADTRHAEGDEALLAAARQGVAELNRRHGPGPGGDRFLLLHRGRVWNKSERRWIGWERKRGKLAELNRLLRGARDTTFVDPPPVPHGVRYVITLDADTKLPRDTVRRLIGKMAHPLNLPKFDPKVGRVVDGYAILQPRVTPALPAGREGSLFLRVFSSATGIDPYAAAVSDVYQDLFGEGSYTGKGVYDVDAFEAALAGRVPESMLLSHDLFEGIFARAGLASDVEVVEDFPARYDVAALRHHRWARGDWQLLPWLIGRAPQSGDERRRDGVPLIGRLKMLDNLRRSLSAPSIVAALLAGWAAPVAAASEIWTVFLVATMALPPLLPVAAAAGRRKPGVPLGSHLAQAGADVKLALVQVGLMLVFLADQARLMGDAILRALVRLTVTRRKLLEWTPAAQAAFGPQPTLASFYRRMGGSLALAAAAGAAFWFGERSPWPLGFALAWIGAPGVALVASRSPRLAGSRPLGGADAETLRLAARRTWRFFETFVEPKSNWLPPDNFQETPSPVVAHRTSPTNIGLCLLSTIAAGDFGWIGRVEAVERLDATFSTLRRLEKHRGHLYNWYDTDDLRPLDPRYVSSVDSGNLAGHLVALAAACREWRASPMKPQARLQGVLDCIALARASASSAPIGPVRSRLLRELDLLSERLLSGPDGWTSLGLETEDAIDAARAMTIEVGEAFDDALYWTLAAKAAIDSHARDLRTEEACGLGHSLEALATAAREAALAMDFAFLLDPDRMLLSIGYKTVEGERDPSCYDLLASEARLASFFAIAKGDAPARHWFRLGRSVTSVAKGAALISWSGSMFEYLMPSLVMRAPAESLIEATNRRVVRRQIDYGREIRVPWGVSESAYNARDLELTYQYSNFGVPGLGLKRGLADNVVVAPYATALAAMVEPEAAVRNLERLAALGGEGRYGFYEALDFTSARVPDGQTAAIVRAYMAHHEGMTIVAIADTLLDGLMRTRFHADPMIKATELLLQERVPRDVIATPPWETSAARPRVVDGVAWRTANPWSATPDTHVLSNGRYSVMVTAAGAGYASWRDLAVTRWREDATCDNWGAWIYLRDVASGDVWSAGLQPTGVAPDDYHVVFNEDRVEIARSDGSISTTLEIVVSAEDDAEARRVTLTNFGARSREIEITSYVELALAPRAADASHPAFSKLFIETEHLPAAGALIAHRRQRSPDEPAIWAAQLAVVDGEVVGTREFGTDRARFIGRGRAVHAPISMVTGRPLSGAAGTVLDPIFALRRRVRLEPGKSARVDFWTMAASSRAEILGLIDKHHDLAAFGRAAALAWTQGQVQLHHLGVDRAFSGQLQRLGGHLIYAAPTLRPASDIIQDGEGGQPLLWSLGVSGDLPIMLVRVSDTHHLDLVREALLASEYWRSKRLPVDLVILNERGSSYVQDLQVGLETLVRASQSRPQADETRSPGHVFVLRADLIAPELISLLVSVARVVLVGERGRLADQMEYAPQARPLKREALRWAAPSSELQVTRRAPDVEYFNGLGGFASDGKEYVVIIEPGQSTPAPWINVIANAAFGFQVSSEGGGYAWSVNAKDHQLTPWSNDPVSDPAGQAIFVRDDDTGELWTATAGPVRDAAGLYVARHGFGYSRFQHVARGLELELIEYVPINDPVRISRLKLRNTSPVARRLSVTAYAEWVLGTARETAGPYVRTWIDDETDALFAASRWNPAFAERVAFVDLEGRQESWTGDRREFIGRNGDLAFPLALSDAAPLSGRVGAGLDPCGALQARLRLAPGEEVEVVLFLGDGADEAEARGLVARCRAADLDQTLADVRRYWDRTLGAARVKTPDRSMDLMLNGWLLYQTLSSRLMGRAGFYQASGAYGFRDQLQDVLALAAARPELAREHLLRCAARQFLEGDVQHWWLPHSGQGVRTRITDDRLWLPYAALSYVEITGDEAIFDASAPFLEAPPLDPGETERFSQPKASEAVGSLYEHCARALDASLSTGGHGCPLIGGGDWNDGLNRAGIGGRGESVWLGWFLIANLRAFLGLAQARGEVERATRWAAHARSLKDALEREAWDGEWYRRGWFDDGAPFGSAASEECRIDSIAQSWAVLSGAGDPERARRAMAALERELILPQDGLALLFTPPFDRSLRDPGYIKGYPPGLRENGGQYTHAAAWSVMAFAAQGEGDKALALFWMLNPINHARTRTDAHRYKVEPYVAAADVYSAPGQVGRGGWTWYTGSAGWLQRAGVESILGLRVRRGALEVDPCIPRTWPGFEATIRIGQASYDVIVENPNGASRGVLSGKLDGALLLGRPLTVPLRDDGAPHRVEVTLG
jgi:cyclic beta-1,2-glucan synthetase